jgi:eukaryotic-like serine/threonine-protein kinase
MESSGESNPTNGVPPDLLPLIRRSGVLNARQLEEVSSKVQRGEYPRDSHALAGRLVAEQILTEFQAKRLLRLKVHGLVVGRYVILDRLGAGAKGRVFRAQHRLMGRVVALKIIAPHIASRASSIARFHREMRMIGRLDHPNVIRAFDADQIGELLYIVMEYVPGRSLDRVLEERGPIPPALAVDYTAQAARGLAHAHERGIVHRDIKPSNLFLSDEGHVKVLDLGLSALMEADTEASFATAAGFVVGTLHYMSPEQSAGIDVDARSDLFSLGCTMYYLLSGRVPFPGDTVAECLARRLRGGFVPITELNSELSPRLVQLLEKLLARRPEDRFQTAAEAALALEALTHGKADVAPGHEPALQPAADASVAEPALSGGVAPTTQPPSSSPSESPSATASPWSRAGSDLTGRPRLVAFLILVFELIVFGVAFTLGHLFANRKGSGDK